jgi:protein TonB
MNAGQVAGLVLVGAAHLALLAGLMQQRLIPVPETVETLFVDFIAPPVVPPREPPRPKPPPPKKHEPVPLRPPDPHPHLVVEAPAAPADFVMPAPQPVPVAEPEPAPAPPARVAGPLTLSGELALVCPSRTAPAYPAFSRRLGEMGTVVLRVELATDGRVDAARIVDSSGYPRLDAAALAAVRHWRCNPPERDGQPVRAIAMQPFQFNLE